MSALNDAKSLHDQAVEQANRTRDMGLTVGDIRDKLLDLMNSSRHAHDNAQAANDLNIRNRRLMDKLKDTIDGIRTGEAAADNTLKVWEDAGMIIFWAILVWCKIKYTV